MDLLVTLVGYLLSWPAVLRNGYYFPRGRRTFCSAKPHHPCSPRLTGGTVEPGNTLLRIVCQEERVMHGKEGYILLPVEVIMLAVHSLESLPPESWQSPSERCFNRLFSQLPFIHGVSMEIFNIKLCRKCAGGYKGLLATTVWDLTITERFVPVIHICSSPPTSRHQ